MKYKELCHGGTKLPSPNFPRVWRGKLVTGEIGVLGRWQL